MNREQVCSYPEPPKTTTFGTKLEVEEATCSSLLFSSFEIPDSSADFSPLLDNGFDVASTCLPDPAASLRIDNKQSVTNHSLTINCSIPFPAQFCENGMTHYIEFRRTKIGVLKPPNRSFLATATEA